MSEPRAILVVEDEEHLAQGIAENLEAEGYRVSIVGEGRAAQRGLDVGGQGGVVEVCAEAVRAAQGQAQAVEARGEGGPRRADHVVAVDAAAQPVDRHAQAARGPVLVAMQRALQLQRADLRVLQGRRPGPGRGRSPGAGPVT